MSMSGFIEQAGFCKTGFQQANITQCAEAAVTLTLQWYGPIDGPESVAGCHTTYDTTGFGYALFNNNDGLANVSGQSRICYRSIIDSPPPPVVTYSASPPPPPAGTSIIVVAVPASTLAVSAVALLLAAITNHPVSTASSVIAFLFGVAATALAFAATISISTTSDAISGVAAVASMVLPTAETLPPPLPPQPPTPTPTPTPPPPPLRIQEAAVGSVLLIVSAIGVGIVACLLYPAFSSRSSNTRTGQVFTTTAESEKTDLRFQSFTL